MAKTVSAKARNCGSRCASASSGLGSLASASAVKRVRSAGSATSRRTSSEAAVGPPARPPAHRGRPESSTALRPSSLPHPYRSAPGQLPTTARAPVELQARPWLPVQAPPLWHAPDQPGRSPSRSLSPSRSPSPSPSSPRSRWRQRSCRTGFLWPRHLAQSNVLRSPARVSLRARPSRPRPCAHPCGLGSRAPSSFRASPPPRPRPPARPRLGERWARVRLPWATRASEARRTRARGSVRICTWRRRHRRRCTPST